MTSEVIKRGFANKKNKFKDLSDKSETKKVSDDLKSGLDDYLSGKKIVQNVVGESKAPESVADLLKKASSEYEMRFKNDVSDQNASGDDVQENMVDETVAIGDGATKECPPL